MGAGAPRGLARPGRRAGIARSARDGRARNPEEGGETHAAAHRNGGAAGSRTQQARREGKAGPAFRPAAFTRPAGAEAPRRAARAWKHVLARGARCDLPPRRDQAQGFRDRRRSRRGPARPGGHALRAEAGAWRQGQPDQRAGEGPRARTLGDQRARRRGDPRQGGGRPRDPERVARTRDARRDPAFARLRRAGLTARACARQGHRRQPDRRGPRQDAAPPDRRHDRLRQVGRHQRHGSLAALQELG